MVMSTEQFQALLSNLTAAQSAGQGSADLTSAIAAISEMAKAQVLATTQLGEQVKRTVRHSNADHEHLGVFNYKADCEYCKTKTRHPEGDAIDSGKMGHPKPAMRRETFWPRGVRVQADDCTVLEVELFNAFETNKSARGGTWTAKIANDGQALEINAPCYFPDERGSLPTSLPQILLELLYGADVVNPEMTGATILNLQKQIDELKARPVSVGA